MAISKHLYPLRLSARLKLSLLSNRICSKSSSSRPWSHSAPSTGHSWSLPARPASVSVAALALAGTRRTTESQLLQRAITDGWPPSLPARRPSPTTAALRAACEKRCGKGYVPHLLPSGGHHLSRDQRPLSCHKQSLERIHLLWLPLSSLFSPSDFLHFIFTLLRVCTCARHTHGGQRALLSSHHVGPRD